MDIKDIKPGCTYYVLNSEFQKLDDEYLLTIKQKTVDTVIDTEHQCTVQFTDKTRRIPQYVFTNVEEAVKHASDWIMDNIEYWDHKISLAYKHQNVLRRNMETLREEVRDLTQKGDTK